MIKKFIKKLSEVLVVFVLLWILAGSLIEFHQRYVFQKNSDLWKVQATQVKTDSKKIFQISNKSVQTLLWGDINTIHQNDGNILVNLYLSEKSIFSRYLFDLLTPEYIYDRSLRGPPIV